MILMRPEPIFQSTQSGLVPKLSTFVSSDIGKVAQFLENTDKIGSFFFVFERMDDVLSAKTWNRV